MKFSNAGHFALLLVLTDMALASDKSRVLMLDTRNLGPEKEFWGNGKDYSVTLAKDNNRAPLPSQFTICNSNFILAVGSGFWFYKILHEDKKGPWIRTFGWPRRPSRRSILELL